MKTIKKMTWDELEKEFFEFRGKVDQTREEKERHLEVAREITRRRKEGGK